MDSIRSGHFKEYNMKHHSVSSYNSVLKRGGRIALRSKVNDSVITGIRIVDSMIAVGRGQRQLILGDRYTGKTSLFLSLLLTNISLIYFHLTLFISFFFLHSNSSPLNHVLDPLILVFLSIGFLLLSFLFYLFLTRIQLFLVLLSFMESFSYLFQSLTVSNRLSINLFAGSLLTALISVAVVSMVSFLAFSLVYFLLVLIVGLVSFEFLNSSIQLFIFGLLTLDFNHFHETWHS